MRWAFLALPLALSSCAHPLPARTIILADERGCIFKEIRNPPLLRLYEFRDDGTSATLYDGAVKPAKRAVAATKSECERMNP